MALSSGNIVINGQLLTTVTTAARGTSDVVLDIGNLNIGALGLLDLTNHDLIIRSGLTLSQVEDLINDGYDNGAWDGTYGITSSTALADGATLSYDTAGNLGLTIFDGIAVSSSDILISYNTSSLNFNLAIQSTPAPEPSTLLLLGLSGSLILMRRKKL